MPFLHCRFEANLLRRPDRRLVQSVPQTFHDSVDFDLPRGKENNVQQHLTLDPKSPRFLRVHRVRFGKECHSLRRRWRIGRFGSAPRRRCHFSTLKAARLHRSGSFRALARRKRRAIAESRARYAIAVTSAASASCS